MTDVRTLIQVGSCIAIALLAITLQHTYYELKLTRSELDRARESLALAEAQAKKKATELAEQIERITDNANTEISQANSRIDSLKRTIANSQRLRCHSSANRDMSSDTAAKDSKNDAGLRDSDAATLAGIAIKGDEAIRRLNACIDAYNTVRGSINGQSKSQE